jgi:hypothetical protein
VAAIFLESRSGTATSGMTQINKLSVARFASRSCNQLTQPYFHCSLGSAIHHRLWFVLKQECFGLRGGSHVQGR